MRVLFFAQAKDAAETSEIQLTVPGGCTVEEVWQLLISARPRLAAFRSTTRLARNNEYADDETVFQNTDEVALIPPVSGG